MGGRLADTDKPLGRYPSLWICRLCGDFIWPLSGPSGSASRSDRGIALRIGVRSRFAAPAKKIARHRPLFCVFNFSVGGAVGLYKPVFPIARPFSLLFFSMIAGRCRGPSGKADEVDGSRSRHLA